MSMTLGLHEAARDNNPRVVVKPHCSTLSRLSMKDFTEHDLNRSRLSLFCNKSEVGDPQGCWRS